jgi:hypothetical protein
MYEEFSFVYARRQGEDFSVDSDAIVLDLDENELQMNAAEIAKVKCPGYDYFLEVFLIQEMFRELRETPECDSDEKKVQRIIYYAENDA